MNKIKKLVLAVLLFFPLIGCSKVAYSYEDFKSEFAKANVNQIHFSTRIKMEELKGTHMFTVDFSEAVILKKMEELNSVNKVEGIESAKAFFASQKDIISKIITDIEVEESSSKLNGDFLYRVEIKNDDKLTYFTINSNGTGSVEKNGTIKYYTISNYEEFANFSDQFQVSFSEEVWKYM